MHLLYFAVYRGPASGTATLATITPTRQHTLGLPNGNPQVVPPAAFIHVVRARQIVQFDAEGASWSSIQ